MTQSPLDEQRQTILEELSAAFAGANPTASWWKPLLPSLIAMLLGALSALATTSFSAGKQVEAMRRLRNDVTSLESALHRTNEAARVTDLKLESEGRATRDWVLELRRDVVNMSAEHDRRMTRIERLMDRNR